MNCDGSGTVCIPIPIPTNYFNRRENNGYVVCMQITFHVYIAVIDDANEWLER